MAGRGSVEVRGSRKVRGSVEAESKYKPESQRLLGIEAQWELGLGSPSLINLLDPRNKSRKSEVPECRRSKSSR